MREEKRNLKSNKAITLIALVVTIIVLLILAGVTIATLTGDNGLLQKATSAKQANEEASSLEKIKVEVAGSYGLDGKIDKTQLINNLGKIQGLTYNNSAIDENTNISSLPATVKLNGYAFIILENGQVEKVTWLQDNTTVMNMKTGKSYEVGDIVTYDCGVSDYTGNWGILGVENGQLLLMSTINVGKVALRGKQDYLTDGTVKLNNACSEYKNGIYADFARCVKIEDINRVVGFDEKLVSIPTYEYTMVDGKVKRNDQQNSGNAAKFEHVDGRKLPDNTPISVTNNYYRYSLSNKLTLGSKAYNLLSDNNNVYWLDNQYAYTNNDSVIWSIRVSYDSLNNGDLYNTCLFLSDGRSFERNPGVRVVIGLKPNVLIAGESTSGYTLR